MSPHTFVSRPTTVRQWLRAAKLSLVALALVLAVAPAAAQRRGEGREGISREELILRLADVNDREARFFNDSFDKVWEQIEEADLSDPRERATVKSVVGRWLGRDLNQIQRLLSTSGDPEAVRRAEQSLREAQIEARENINQLADGKPLEVARQLHTRMTGQWDKLSQHYALILESARIMQRRERLLGAWRKLEVDNDRMYTDQRETALRQRVEATAGMPLEQVAAVVDAGLRQPPAWGKLSERYLWQYHMARRIANYNRTLAGHMDSREYQNVQLLNAYREAAGILPLEADARAIQAARRHSKEMVELGYFAHESPTPENRSFGMRMKKAGYDKPGGENIAAGYADGERAFWGWFYSPGHHKNMMNPGFTAIGVGRWQRHYTQNFGRGQRLMLLANDARGKVAVLGEILKPQG